MTRKAVPVVTIDGPSGSGKGTIGRLLAQKLEWHYLDSGVLYRLVALAALRRNLDFRDAASLAATAAGLDARFTPAAAGDRVYLEGGHDHREWLPIRSQGDGHPIRGSWDQAPGGRERRRLDQGEGRRRAVLGAMQA